jgi:hypothetical protein
VLCQRCTRFSDEIAGDKFIDLMERSSNEQIGVFRGDPDSPADDEPFNSYFSGNTIQICPVGALTSSQYRFRARPFDLVSTPNTCEHCAAGCDQRADHRRGKVMRRLAGDDPAVNEEWNCDKGRFAFQYVNATDRIATPMVRDAKTGELRAASWPEALATAAAGLAAARDGGGVGVLTGGRLTVEDAYAYAKFARVALGTNDIDFRARPLSAEETEFLGSHVVGRADVTYADIERAPAVVFVGLEPEEECPIIFLRARKIYLKKGLASYAVAPFVSRGFSKLGYHCHPHRTGRRGGGARRVEQLRDALSAEGALLFVGERLASVEGGLSAATLLAEQTGARLAWVPRRAGERGAVEAGALPTLLPGGRRSTTRPRAARLPPRGTSTRASCPARRAATPTGSSPRPARAGSARCSSPVSTRRTCRPAGGRGGSRQRRLRGQPGAADERRREARRRHPPDRRGGREVRQLRQLGGPGPAVRHGAQDPDDDRRARPRHARSRSSASSSASATSPRCGRSSPRWPSCRCPVPLRSAPATAPASGAPHRRSRPARSPGRSAARRSSPRGTT